MPGSSVCAGCGPGGRRPAARRPATHRSLCCGRYVPRACCATLASCHVPQLFCDSESRFFEFFCMTACGISLVRLPVSDVSRCHPRSRSRLASWSPPTAARRSTAPARGGEEGGARGSGESGGWTAAGGSRTAAGGSPGPTPRRRQRDRRSR